MAKVSDMNGRVDGGYFRLFGDKKRGHLASQIHAASIRAGNELEKNLGASIGKQHINTLRNIFKDSLVNHAKEVVLKPSMPRSGETRGIVSDFAVFYHREQRFIVVELKDGDTFDTQKSPATKTNLQTITTYISHHTHYSGDFAVCSFNATDKQAIVDGFKRQFTIDQVMTGYELCFHLEVDYEDIMNQRASDQAENRHYFDDMAAAIGDGINDDDYFHKADEHKTGQLRMRLD